MLRFFVLMTVSVQLMACTGVLIQAKDASVVTGRTVEFGIPLDMHVAVVPRNTAFTGKTPLGAGLSYKSKYAVVGAYAFDDIALMDGMNEKGLTVGAFYFSGYADYAKVTKSNQMAALSPADFPNWILTQFATIEEVEEALDSVIIAPTVLEGWGDVPPPLHYIVYDRMGRSIVIEPVDGAFKVYENPLGVMSNSPTFEWHLTNLSNYLHCSPFNAPPNALRSFPLAVFGQGTGMLGIPGDFSPPSRFVRAAFFSAALLPVANSDAAVDQMFHMLNQFDIPLGAVRQKGAQKTYYDYTMFTSVKAPATLQYFYKSYEDQTIRFVDLRQFDLNAPAVKSMKILGGQKKYDVSSMLQ